MCKRWKIYAAKKKRKKKKERPVRKIDSIGSVRSAKNRNHTKPNEKKPLSVENGKS